MADEVKVHIGADITDFLNAMKLVSGQLGQFGALGTKVSNALGKMASPAALAATALVAVGAAAGALTMKGINLADEMNKLSMQTGMSAESLSTLKYAAEQSEIPFEGLTQGMKFLQRSMFDVTTGGKEASAAFKSLGISVTESNGQLKTTDQVLMEVADRFANTENGASKTALALKLFGRAGQQLIPFLNEGSAGIEKLKEEARKLGLEISTKTAKGADDLKDALSSIQSIGQGAGNVLAKNLVPALGFVVEWFKKSMIEGGAMAWVFNTAIPFGVKMVIGVFGVLITAIKLVIDWYKMLAQSAMLFATGNFKASFDVIKQGIASIPTTLADSLVTIDALMAQKNPLAPLATAAKNLPGLIIPPLAKVQSELSKFAETLSAQFEGLSANMIVSITEGSSTFKEVMRSFLSNILKMSIEWGIKQLGVFSFIQKALMGLGTIGGFLVIGAGLVALAALSKGSFASGSDYIPRNMTANIHEGERVVPKETNKDLTEYFSEKKDEPIQTHIYLDGKQIFEVLSQGMRDGRMTVPPKAVRS